MTPSDKHPYGFFVIVALLIAIGYSVCASGQSLSALKIVDPSSQLSSLGKPAAIDNENGMTVRRWIIPNGNELSITTDMADKIVYMESDWNPGKDDTTACDLPGLRFGVTTLAQLRKRFGSNGFAFKDQAGQLLTEDGAVMLNSYEASGFVITFYNKVSNKEVAQLNPESQGTIADHARLDAISIASPEYAKREWGNRVYDPSYKPIDWK
jgi:hypothetical protein